MKTKRSIKHFAEYVVLIIGVVFSLAIADKTAADDFLPSEYIWVGDSHVTALAGVIGGVSPSRTTGVVRGADKRGNYWSSRSAEGLTWMKRTGMPNVSSRLGNNKALIIWMGTNDAYSYGKYGPLYVQYLTELSMQIRENGMKVFFVNVAHVNDARSPYLKNRRIEEFNRIIKNGVNWNDSLYYVDLYSYTRGYSASQITSDGFHYPVTQCREIYNWVISQVDAVYRKAALSWSKPAITNLRETAEGTLRMQCVNRGRFVKGYEFKWALNKSMTDSVGTGSSSKHFMVINGLIGGKTYYVRVRTFKMKGGKKVYSRWSAAKTIKLKILPIAPVLLKVEKHKWKGFILNWKPENGVAGYQISWSENPSFKPKRTASYTGGEITSATKRNLERGKTYYVRVRSFKYAVDGTRYFSAWSTSKEITIE